MNYETPRLIQASEVQKGMTIRLVVYNTKQQKDLVLSAVIIGVQNYGWLSLWADTGYMYHPHKDELLELIALPPPPDVIQPSLFTDGGDQ